MSRDMRKLAGLRMRSKTAVLQDESVDARLASYRLRCWYSPLSVKPCLR